jgi:hypothetical protein
MSEEDLMRLTFEYPRKDYAFLVSICKRNRFSVRQYMSKLLDEALCKEAKNQRDDRIKCRCEGR